MTTDAYGDRHKIDCIASLLKAESLEERATVIEKALENGSDAFDFITREALLDYLTNSNIHTETKKSAQEFLNSLYGKNTNTPEGGGQIIAFPKKND